MSDRSVVFTGIRFENPFLLSSAPPTESENNILRAFDAGWGGVVTKTIGLHPVVNVVGAKAKFIRTSIVDPDADVAEGFRPNIMPGNFGTELSKEELDALVKYLLEAQE